MLHVVQRNLGGSGGCGNGGVSQSAFLAQGEGSGGKNDVAHRGGEKVFAHRRPRVSGLLRGGDRWRKIWQGEICFSSARGGIGGVRRRCGANQDATRRCWSA